MFYVTFIIFLMTHLVFPTNGRDFIQSKYKNSGCLRAGNTSYCNVPHIKAIIHKEAEKRARIHQISARRAEDVEEFQKLKRKWRDLIKEHGPSETLHLIPSDWLLSTAHHNVTFNLTQIKSVQTKKILNLIKKHEVHDDERHENFRQFPTGQDKLHQHVVLSTSLLDKIKNTGQKMVNKSHKNSTNELEKTVTGYPGKNQTIRKELFEQWETYYQCLRNNTDFVPRAHYALPGESIRMQCPACLKSGDETKIVWTLATLRTRHKEEDINLSQKKSAFSSNNRISITERGLLLYIYGVNERDAGNYTCRVLKTVLTVHLVQVAEAAENITRVWPKNRTGKPQATPALTLPNFGIKVFTKWKNWTSCSRCARVGKRFRVGVCAVGASNSKSPAILSLFKEGIPCRSMLLPKSIQDHPYVISRRSEIMEAFCKEPCPKEKKYVVRNKKGQIVEEADNGKGVYSMLQKLPQLPPPIKRKILFYKQWDTAYIQCPGSLLNDVPTHWFINYQPIYSKGDRIYVTPSHTLVIEDLGLSDSSLYSCWQGSKLVGTVRLVISQPIRLTFSQQISTISMILIVSTFVIIFLRALCNSMRSRQ